MRSIDTLLYKVGLLLSGLLCTGLANSAILDPVSVYASGGGYNNSLGLITNNYIPNEGSGWNAPTNVYWSGTSTKFTINYGAVFNIQSILTSVDHNDDYRIEWSANGSSWSTLYSMSRSSGNISNGMDTFELNFSPVQAQYLSIRALGGDNRYAIGELRTYGTAISQVPVPAAAWLFGSGLLGLIGMARCKNTV